MSDPAYFLSYLFQPGYATVNVTIFEDPAAGDCYLLINGSKPITGKEQAYYDVFTLKCENWEDEFEWPLDPLRYRFFALDESGGRACLNTGAYDKSSVDFFLPPGTTQLMVEIYSQSGSIAVFNLAAVASLDDPFLQSLAPEEIAFWIQSVKLQPCLFDTGIHHICFVRTQLNPHSFRYGLRWTSNLADV